MSGNRIYKACKGCRTIDRCGMNPVYECGTCIKICPCVKCLVKGICKKPCEIYKIYVDLNYWRHRKMKVSLNQ